MKAICVTSARELELRDIPAPRDPPAGHLVVRIEAAAINHGDKTFLKRREAAGPVLARSLHDVWGASAAGEVIAAGPEVPSGYLGRRVAVYRSLGRGPATLGLWCDRAQVPFTACLRLPEGAEARSYSGSLVNIITAHAFLEQVVAEGLGGVMATAGGSATGHALAALARRRGVPALLLVRSATAKAELERHGVENVFIADTPDATEVVGRRAETLGTKAVFDGVGGEEVSRLLPTLPQGATLFAYGFLGGTAPISFPTSLLMAKALTLKRFSNFETTTVRDPQALEAALHTLEAQVDHALFTTRIGRTFAFDQFDAAMAYEATPGAKAILVP